jgi:hypothetical protein
MRTFLRHQGREPNGLSRGRNLVSVSLVVIIIALASAIIYQQSQLAALSGVVSSQSSRLSAVENPSSDLKILNLTVAKENATAEPVIFAVLWNDGVAPIDSIQLSANLFGQGGGNATAQTCYTSAGTYIQLHSNETQTILSPLTCGNINDTVVLNVDADFLTSKGSALQAYNAKTIIIHSQAVEPQLVAVDQLGIKSWIGYSVGWSWHLSIVNEGQTAVESISATLGPPANPVAQVSSCVGGGLHQVSRTSPLGPGATCQIDSQIKAQSGTLSIGQSLQVVVSVAYINGTNSAVTTSAVVEPPYAVIH